LGGETDACIFQAVTSDESLLDRLEMRLGAGLREDAARVRRMEATARILLALPPDQGLSMAELARRIGRDPSTVTRFAARAAREGLVEQRLSDEDGRRRLLLLTVAGRATRTALLERRRAREAAVVDAAAEKTGLGPSEVEWFLSAVADALGR
jgi:DNA-binding MarR family transcriptional regulator